MSNVRLTQEQAEKALARSAGIRSRPGMWIGGFDWRTAAAYWKGFFDAIDDEAFGDFWTWGLEHLDATDSNVDPVGELRRRYGFETDDVREPSFSRERATVIAGLICDLVDSFVNARRL